jgi:crossover junction endodeoxyribonuclease RuvC
MGLWATRLRLKDGLAQGNTVLGRSCQGTRWSPGGSVAVLILGLDPGLAITGYGIVAANKGEYEAAAYGKIATEARMTHSERLVILYDAILELTAEFRPDMAAVEQLFFNRNVTSALAVGQARGVALLCLAKQNLPVGEYTPLQVKQALTGHGRAEKSQVGYMVRTLLGLGQVPKPDDVSDALAVALCHAFHAESGLLRLVRDGNQ